MAGEIGYNGFRVRVYDKNSNKTLTDCVVVATHNGIKYSLPYDQSQGDNRLEVASVGQVDDYTLEVTCDGYHSYVTSANTYNIVQVPLSPKLSVLEQCNKIQKIKDDIKVAMTDMGVACDDVLSSYATLIENNFARRVSIEVRTPALAVGMTFEIPYYNYKSTVGAAYEIAGIQPNGDVFYTSFYTGGFYSSILDNIQDVGGIARWQGKWKFKREEDGTKKYVITIEKKLR